MKKSVTSYCFDRKLKSGELDLRQCVLCAAETGFDAIEFTDFTPPEGYSEREYAAVLREEADKNHIEISAFSVGAELLRPDGTVSRDAVERVKSKVDVAAALGCRVMRHDVTRGFAPRGNGMKGFFSVKDRLGRRVPGDYALRRRKRRQDVRRKPRLLLSGLGPRRKSRKRGGKRQFRRFAGRGEFSLRRRRPRLRGGQTGALRL